MLIAMRAESELILTIRELGRNIFLLTNSFTIIIGCCTLAKSIACTIWASISPTRADWINAALLTNMSTWPSKLVSKALAMIFGQSADVMSAAIPTTLGAVAFAASAYRLEIVRDKVSIRCRVCVLEQVPRILQPRLARFIAVALPMPLLDPLIIVSAFGRTSRLLAYVMTATFPARSCSRTLNGCCPGMVLKRSRILWENVQYCGVITNSCLDVCI